MRDSETATNDSKADKIKVENLEICVSDGKSNYRYGTPFQRKDGGKLIRGAFRSDMTNCLASNHWQHCESYTEDV